MSTKPSTKKIKDEEELDFEGAPSITILEIEKETVIEDGTRQTRVKFSFSHEPERTHTHAFPLDTSKEDIIKELKRVRKTLVTDQKNHAKRAEQDAKEAVADEAIGELDGAIIQ